VSRYELVLGNDPVQLAALQARSWETARVLFLLKRTGLGHQAQAFRTAYARRHGTPGLSFAMFNEAYPSFPYLLEASLIGGCPLHDVTEAAFPCWLRAFSDLPFVPFFEETLARTAGHEHGRDVAMVFPRHGFQQGLVIHTAFEEPGDGPRFVYRSKGFEMAVRPFDRLIDEAGRDWREGGGPETTF